MNLVPDTGSEFRLFERQHPLVGGVGLYPVQRIVSSADGHLAVASTVGEGTTFTVRRADKS